MKQKNSLPATGMVVNPCFGLDKESIILLMNSKPVQLQKIKLSCLLLTVALYACSIHIFFPKQTKSLVQPTLPTAKLKNISFLPEQSKRAVSLKFVIHYFSLQDDVLQFSDFPDLFCAGRSGRFRDEVLRRKSLTANRWPMHIHPSV